MEKVRDSYGLNRAHAKYCDFWFLLSLRDNRVGVMTRLIKHRGMEDIICDKQSH